MMIKTDDLIGRIYAEAVQRASGGRNDAGLWLACQLRDNGVPFDVAEAVARKYAEAVRGQGKHAYTVREALASLKQAYAKPAREPWGRKKRRVWMPRRTVDLSAMPAVDVPARPEAAGWQSDGWQSRVYVHVAEAVERLAALPNPGAAYLAGRGFDPVRLARTFAVGYVEAVNGRPARAISLPAWRGDAICAVNYRLIDNPGGQRYRLAKGSQRWLFDARPGHRPNRPALVIAEGELNALAIWQAAGDAVDAVSIGAERLPDAMRAALASLARDYARVIAWTDKPETAAEVLSVTGKGGGWRITSPVGPDGRKWDAAAILAVQPSGVYEAIAEALHE